MIAVASRRLIWTNDRGYPVGEDHHRAKLSDAQVDTVRDLREAGRLSYEQLSVYLEFWGCEVSVSTIKKICQYRRRVATRERCVRRD